MLSVPQRYFMVTRPGSYIAVASRLLNNSTFLAFNECLDYTGGTKFPTYRSVTVPTDFRWRPSLLSASSDGQRLSFECRKTDCRDVCYMVN